MGLFKLQEEFKIHESFLGFGEPTISESDYKKALKEINSLMNGLIEFIEDDKEDKNKAEWNPSIKYNPDGVIGNLFVTSLMNASRIGYDSRHSTSQTGITVGSIKAQIKAYIDQKTKKSKYKYYPSIYPSMDSRFIGGMNFMIYAEPKA